MLLKQQYQQGEICREAEAFAATCLVFKLKIAELALMSGLDRMTIEKFRDGSSEISTTTLFKILKVLTPNERNFYNALMEIQYAAGDAGVTLPLLDLAPDIKVDVFRDALTLTMQVFGVCQKDIYTAAGMQNSNFSAWMTGRRDMNLGNLGRVKAALSREQRSFFEAVASVFVTLEPHPPERRPSLVSSQQLNIA